MPGEEYSYLPGSSPQRAGGYEIHCIEQTVNKADMTDGGAAAGTISLTEQLPIGAIPMFWTADVKTAFTGDTSAVIKAGVATDDDRFSADTTQSVFAAGFVGSGVLAADALKGVGAAQTVRVTITTAADFTAAAAGKFVFRLYYLRSR